MTTHDEVDGSVVAILEAFFAELRSARGAEELHYTQLGHFAERLRNVPSIVQRAERDASSIEEAAVSEIHESIPKVGALPDSDVSSEVVQDILRTLLVHRGERKAARAALVRRYGESGVTDNALRRRGGLEERSFSALAHVMAAKSAAIDDSMRASVRVQELYFGLVLWLGTDFIEIRKRLDRLLAAAGFHVETVKLSDALPALASEQFSVAEKDDDLIEYLNERMDAGNEARSIDPGILAESAIERITELRREVLEAGRLKSNRGIAYVLDSLMNPSEVELLRNTYGNLFFLVAIHEDEISRKDNLMEEPGLAAWANAHPEEDPDQAVTSLLERNRGIARRDMIETVADHQLSVERVFHLADVFVDVANPTRSHVQADTDQPASGLSDFTVDQFIGQIFSNPFSTPTRHEAGMAHAYVEATRSASIARRVGAAVCTDDGELVSVGVNEVPAPGGGQYPKKSLPDHREHAELPTELVAPLSSDELKMEMLHDVLVGLVALGVVTPPQPELFSDLSPTNAAEVAREIIEMYPQLRDAKLFDIIEFGRTVHAEMAAILNAMRRSQSVAQSILYCTTFPCHECARHIIMSGIKRVVYVEPYPKSRVFDLHPDAAVPGSSSHEAARVEFVPFIGIAPRRQPDLYSEIARTEATREGVAKVEWTLGPHARIRDTILARDLGRQMLQLAAVDAMEGAVVKLLDARREGDASDSPLEIEHTFD